MQTRILLAAVAACSAIAAPALAASVKVPMAMATPTGKGAEVGSVTFSDAKGGGVSVKLDLHGLPPGEHGFHVHEKPSCEAATAADGKVTPAGAAGGHLDPGATAKHLGPEGGGHLGDLPRVSVAADGTAKETLTAPHIESAAELKGHAIMLHAGGDNYADQPAPLGGGGARMACGVAA
jgi:Cu-Zn family superoxide dismutase